MVADFGGQIVHLHAVAIHEDAQALHEVFQFAHIARPAIGKQHSGRIFSEPQQRPVLLVTEALEKALRQDQDVHAALAKRRQMQRNNVQAIVQILTKTPGSDLAFQISVGGGHDADIYLLAARASHALDFLFLQNPQNLDLQTQIHLADFIKKNGAAVRQFKPARPGADGVGECPLFMPEKFAFQQFLGNGAAIDGHKGTVRPAAVGMQGPHKQFLACS